MRIGIDARLLAYQRGGTTTYIRRLLEHLGSVAPGHQVLALKSRKQLESELPQGCVEWRSLWTPPHHTLEQLALPLELLPLSLDVLHSPDFIPPFYRRCPSVITVHDLSFYLFPETKTEEALRYYRQTERAVNNAEGIIAVSETTRQDLQRVLGVPPGRVEVIYHGVDEQYHVMEDRAAVASFCRESGLPDSFMLWVGTLEPRKNLECLFQALALACRRLPPEKQQLVVVGPMGWRFEQTRKLYERLGLKDRVIFFGPAGESDLALLYNAAWAFVFPSLYEGFGMPPLEAMACGTPVLASSTPALKEVLGEAALYFDPHQPPALSEFIVRLAEDAQLAGRLREVGLQRAQRFRWEDTARRTLEVYRKAAGV